MPGDRAACTLSRVRNHQVSSRMAAVTKSSGFVQGRSPKRDVMSYKPPDRVPGYAGHADSPGSSCYAIIPEALHLEGIGMHCILQPAAIQIRDNPPQDL